MRQTPRTNLVLSKTKRSFVATDQIPYSPNVCIVDQKRVVEHNIKSTNINLGGRIERGAFCSGRPSTRGFEV